MLTKKYSFDDHPEHKAQLSAWRDRWIANALNVTPMTDVDREAMRVAINGLYAAAELPAPQNIVFASGPVTGGVAAAIAAGVWWLREHPDSYRALGLSGLTEDVLRRAIPVACEHVFGRPTSLQNATDTATIAAVNSAVNSATNDAVYGATNDAVYDAVIDSISTSTDSATNSTVIEATNSAVSAATEAATNNALYEATNNAVFAAVFAATRAETFAATEAATRVKTYDATKAATDTATNSAVYEATNSAANIATNGAVYEAIIAATNSAVYEATNSAANIATNGAVIAATYSATYSATEAATDSATNRAISASAEADTEVATNSATDTATIDAVDSAVSAATNIVVSATNNAVSAATKAATDTATDDAVYEATNDATNSATYDATFAATNDAVYEATNSATIAATNTATNSAVYEATEAAVFAAVFAATKTATDSATNSAVIAATDIVSRTARFLVSCSANWARLRHGGNYWSGWVAHISFFRHVAKIPIDYSHWAHAESAAIHGGPRFMHSRFCAVADRPRWIHRDEANKPHRIDGPFCQWRDGVKLYRVRGVEVPPEWIEHRDEVDVALALTHPNLEQRRALCEILGWSKVLANLNPRTIDKDTDPEIGELIEVDLPDAGACRFLRVRCGTGREFVLAVPQEMQTARASNAWSYGLSSTQMKIEVRT